MHLHPNEELSKGRPCLQHDERWVMPDFATMKDRRSLSQRLGKGLIYCLEQRQGILEKRRTNLNSSEPIFINGFLG
jgi:hypothetical protein